MENFQTYSLYYDLLYKDKDYDAEASYVLEKLRDFSIDPGPILEFGSGTGQHAVRFVACGYDVTGIELSADMVARVPELPGLEVMQGDVTHELSCGQYGAVVSLFHVMSYQTENSKVAAVFDNAARHLNSGGLFLFDFWFSPAVCAQRPSITVKKMEKGGVKITRLAEPSVVHSENRVDVNYSIFLEDSKADNISMFTEVHPMRHFGLLELDLFAERSGFTRVFAEEFLSGSKPSEDTWGVCVGYKRI